MAEALLAPDVEALALDWLLAPGHLSVAAGTRVPKVRPPEFVRVARLGGIRRDLVIDQPLLGFWCWAKTTLRASELARTAEAWMFAWEGRDAPPSFVYEVTAASGIGTSVDPDTGDPMCTFTTQVLMRVTPLS